MPLSKELRVALVALKATRNVDAEDRVIHSERDAGMSPGAVRVWFHRLYNDALGFKGASSHTTTQRYIQGDTDAKRKVVDM